MTCLSCNPIIGHHWVQCQGSCLINWGKEAVRGVQTEKGHQSIAQTFRHQLEGFTNDFCSWQVWLFLALFPLKTYISFVKLLMLILDGISLLSEDAGVFFRTGDILVILPIGILTGLCFSWEDAISTKVLVTSISTWSSQCSRLQTIDTNTRGNIQRKLTNRPSLNIVIDKLWWIAYLSQD